MARRITYLKILRKTHFFSSIVILSFTTLYIFTGVVMTQSKIFDPGKAEKQIATHPLNVLTDTSNHVEFLKEIKEVYELEGRVGKFERMHNDKITALYARPGVRTQIKISNSCDSIFIETSHQHTFARVAGRLHHIHGFHGGWLYVVWGVLFDLAAASFLVFAISGILIWIKLRKSFKYGWFIIIPIALIAIIQIIRML